MIEAGMVGRGSTNPNRVDQGGREIVHTEKSSYPEQLFQFAVARLASPDAKTSYFQPGSKRGVIAERFIVISAPEERKMLFAASTDGQTITIRIGYLRPRSRARMEWTIDQTEQDPVRTLKFQEAHQNNSVYRGEQLYWQESGGFSVLDTQTPLPEVDKTMFPGRLGDIVTRELQLGKNETWRVNADATKAAQNYLRREWGGSEEKTDDLNISQFTSALSQLTTKAE